MSSDAKRIYELKDTANAVLSELTAYKDLFDESVIDTFKSKKNQIDRDIARLEEKNRTLRIGVVGTVKAGKSSLLNACFFNGESTLPKAAISTTAALTRITYGQEDKSVVHFYTHDEYETICELSKRYDDKLDNEYQRYVNQFETTHKQSRQAEKNIEGEKNSNSKGNPFKNKSNTDAELTLLSREEFAKTLTFDEQCKGAHELTDAIKAHNTDLSMLGKTVPIDGSFDKLSDYISGDGVFTPIVSYVEIQTSNKDLEDTEIIDTPGLNDAITSRSNKTKEFLSDCDVVILLSRCGHFMDDLTINLMCNYLPDNNVHRILVVGSRLDSGIASETRPTTLKEAYVRSINSYRNTFLGNLNRIGNQTVESGKRAIINLMKEDLTGDSEPKNTLFVSSMMYSAGLKLMNNIPLDSEEKKMMENLNRFSGYEYTPENLMSLSGIDDVMNRIAELKGESTEILSEKDSEVVSSVAKQMANVLTDLNREIMSSKHSLETQSVEELKRKHAIMEAALQKSDVKISTLFTNASLDCEKREKRIKSILKTNMSSCNTLQITSKTQQGHRTVSTGFLGLKKEVVPTTRTDYEASTAEVKINLQKYDAKCTDTLSTEFVYLVNSDALSYDLKEALLEVFRQSESEYSEEDILIPLSTVLKKIQIPTVQLATSKYIDRVNSAFPDGYASNQRIHELESMQITLLCEMDEDMEKQLTECVKQISKMMDKEAITFADEIKKKMKTDIDRLIKQQEDKEINIRLYTELEEKLAKMKAELTDYII